MPHSHFCRHCQNEFICPENAADCFRKYIVCRDCFWTIEVKYFALVVILAVIAIWLTLLLLPVFTKQKKADGQTPSAFSSANFTGTARAGHKNTTQGKYNNERNKAS